MGVKAVLRDCLFKSKNLLAINQIMDKSVRECCWEKGTETYGQTFSVFSKEGGGGCHPG
jgi:hypothetical protein